MRGTIVKTTGNAKTVVILRYSVEDDDGSGDVFAGISVHCIEAATPGSDYFDLLDEPVEGVEYYIEEI